MNIFPRAHYETLNEIRVYADNIAHNLHTLRAHQPNKRVAIILKSNAYGHGLVETARICDNLKPAFLMVDSTYEALTLKDCRLKTPILVLGFTHETNLQNKRYPFTFVANSLDALALLLCTQTTPIHLFINTGMNREGIAPDEIDEAYAIIGDRTHRIEGIATHFFEADHTPPTSATQSQISTFESAIKKCETHGLTFTYIHADASNSAAHCNAPGNLMRAGRIIYGVGDDHALYARMKPALAFISHIVDIRTLKAGDRIGYDGTFTAPCDMRVGLLPAGYQEGVHRNLSNCGTVTIREQPCRIIGRVSMNYTSIDISHINANIGDEVVIYSHRAHDNNSIVHAARAAHTIEHELLCYLSPTVRRVVI